MEFSLQRAVLLVLGGLVPAAVFIADRAEIFVAVTLVNVLIIWGSLHVATGGSLRPGSASSDAADPDEA
ncbi:MULTISPECIES: hypothetical protein [unclassified Halorubrum]|uniref:hypothetical protein n=1 Tax=unclassified Halorubrum TaxID=2642239 RepID=UPI000B983AB1|nr:MULTISPECIES: hypothetical protein [unclassified Halorubrum]OYR38785.1 hypothetical protein DJ75_17455 [Halorubrum sp. Eb13]OYR42903.1 hypothetical protein DJ81_10245 [Halorubrum sp. Hd13]OYR49233.1 hypothetical protein DJ73_17975 [Halorubrum sp. Ea1]OYR52432.1 hypothetical protein DJ74_01405 [Halorubrum sp. Ea8]